MMTDRPARRRGVLADRSPSRRRRRCRWRRRRKARQRASGYVEATEVRVAPQVGGRVLEVAVAEGDRVAAGDVDRAARYRRRRAGAAARRSRSRPGACAQLRLLQAGAARRGHPSGAAQAESAQADVRAAEVRAARPPPPTSSASRRCSSPTPARANSATMPRRGATWRRRACTRRASGRGPRPKRSRGLRAGARAEEIAGARARVAAAEAQIATLEKNARRRRAEVAGRRHRDGEARRRRRDGRAAHAGRRRHRSRSRLGQRLRRRAGRAAAARSARRSRSSPTPAQRLEGTITFISPKAEFTPRNVQTAEERSKLVYRIKVTADNRDGVLKPGMPVEAELPGSGGNEPTPPSASIASRKRYGARRRAVDDAVVRASAPARCSA